MLLSGNAMSSFKVFSLFFVGLSLSAGERSTSMTARCRAQCLDRFTVVGSGKNCLADSECWMCWDTCKMFYTNFEIWGDMCSAKEICFPGCQESCKFYNSHNRPVSHAHRYRLGSLKLEHFFEPSRDRIHFQWSYPNAVSQIEPLVYVFTMNDILDSTWTQVEQTFYRNLTVRRGLLKASSKILLAAYNADGKVAEIEKPVTELPVARDDPYFNEMTLRDQDYHPEQENVHKNIELLMVSWCPKLLSLKYSIKNIGAVDAVISWPKINEKIEKYELEWKLADPVIDSAGYLRNSNNMAVIPLWPNNLYEIKLRAYVSGLKRPVTQSKSLIVDTSFNVFGKHPLRGDCVECIPIESLLTMLSIVLVILFSGTISYLLLSVYYQRKQDNAEAQRKQHNIEAQRKQLNNEAQRQQLNNKAQRKQHNSGALKKQHNIEAQTKQVSSAKHCREPRQDVKKTLSAVSAKLAAEAKLDQVE